MLAIYGEKGGFGWKLDQIVGAQIIVVPAHEQDLAAKTLVTNIALLFAGAFALVLLIVNLLLPRNPD